MIESLIIACLFILGSFGVAPLKNRCCSVERYGISFVAGACATSLAVILALALFPGKPPYFQIALIFFIASLIIWSARIFLTVKQETAGFDEKRVTRGIAVKIIFFLFVLSTVFAWYFPVSIPDGMNYYDGIGYKIADTGKLSGLVEGEVRKPVQRTMLIQSLHGLIYLAGGERPKIIYPFLYLSLLTILYGRVLAHTRDHERAILFTLLAGSSPIIWFHSFITLNNIAATIGFFGGIAYWHHCSPNEKDSFFFSRMAGLFLAFSAWARLEYTLFVLMMVFLSGVLGKFKNNPLWIWNLSLPTILLVGGWEIFVRFLWGSGSIDTNVSLLAVGLLVFISLTMREVHEWGQQISKWLTPFFGKKLPSIHFRSAVCGVGLIFLAAYLIYWKSFPAILQVLGLLSLSFVLFHLTWLFTSFLLLRVTGLMKGTEKREIELFWVIILFYLVSTAIFSGMAAQDVDRAVHILLPDFQKPISFMGSFFNTSNNRHLMSAFVVWVFLFGCYKKYWGSGRHDIKLIWAMVWGNLLICAAVFGFSRINFIIENPLASPRQVRVSKGTFDLPNMDHYRYSWKLLYLLLDVTKKNEIIAIGVNDVNLTILARLSPRQWKWNPKGEGLPIESSAAGDVVVLSKEKWHHGSRGGSLIGEIKEKNWVVIRRL